MVHFLYGIFINCNYKSRCAANDGVPNFSCTISAEQLKSYLQTTAATLLMIIFYGVNLSCIKDSSDATQSMLITLLPSLIARIWIELGPARFSSLLGLPGLN